MSEGHAAADHDGLLERVLARALAGERERGVAVVGRDPLRERLLRARPDLFSGANGSGRVLAAGADPATLELAAERARASGSALVYVLAEGVPLEAVRERVTAAGLAIAGVERLLFAPAAAPAPSRLARLEAETRALLVRCVLRDHPDAVSELEAALLRLQRDLDLLAQLEVDHARTRDVERERAERLARLEETVARLASSAAALEAERLRAELELIRSTRLWRVAQRWWAFRSRRRGRASRG